MQAANNMMFISPESASPSREAGHLSAGKAGGQPPAPDTWAAVVEDMAATTGEGVAPQVPASEAGQSVLTALLPAIDNARMTVRPKEDGPQQPLHGEPGELLPVNTTTTSAKQYPAGPPNRSAKPMHPEAAQDHGGLESREAGACPVQGANDIIVFENATASSATPADPSQLPDDTAEGAARPAPVDTPMVNAVAEKDGTMAQARAGDQTAARFLPPVEGKKAPEPALETKGYQAAQGPDTLLPSRGAPMPSHPAMPEKDPSQPVSLPQTDPQTEKRPSADLAASVAALARKHHSAGKNQPANTRLRQAPSVEGLPGKSPATPESHLPGQLAVNRPQTATLAGSSEIGRLAHDAGPNAQQPAVPSAGQIASQASISAASVSTTAPLIHADGAVLRLELPLWSAVGIPEMPVNENQDIHPTSDLPRASREMRMLSDVIEKAYWHQENGRAQARIQIKPAFLGHLHLNVLTDQARVSVEIRVETLMAREFIEMNLHTLKTDLQDSGLEIDRIDVVVDRDADDSREPYRESARKQNRRPGTAPELVETAPPDNATTPPETENTENSINYFA